MAHELILTSVPQGLEQDSQGFSVVGTNRRIPPALVKRLKSISNYRHLFSPDSAEAKHHPVVYSHLIVPTPDTSWHVLSRIADTGWDYRHEANHLVHHIALREDEKVEEGPAWLMGLCGFHFTEWQTPPARFDLGRPIPTLTAPPPLTRRQRIARERFWLDHRKTALSTPATEEPESLQAMARENEEQMVISGPPTTPCASWQEMLGDAGWGGILAETIRTAQPAVIVYRPGMNIFPLLIESLAVLPREYAWKATFTTFFTGLPEHIPCQWKGVIAGTLEADALTKQKDHLVIDLTIPMGKVPSGAYVEYARHGIENMLPDNESDDSVFVSQDSDTKQFYFSDEDNSSSDNAEMTTSVANESTIIHSGSSSSATPPVQAPPVLASEEDDLLRPASSADPSLTPPVLQPETVTIRTRSATTGKGAFGSLLNMKSKGQFYVLYGTTLFLILFLIVLVLDQFVDFGIARWFQGTPDLKNQAVTKQDNKNPNKKPEANTKHASRQVNENPDGKLSEEAIQKRQQRLQKQQESQIKAVAEQKEKRRKQVEQIRVAFEEKRQKNAADLIAFLLDFSLPPSLDLTVPDVRDAKIIPPEKPQLLPEFAQLYPFGLGLDIDLIPLLDIPKIRIETEKRRLTRRLDDITDFSNGETAEASPLGEPDALQAESSLLDSPDDFLVPDENRFEWDVFAVDEETDNKTPMFRLNLTKDGLLFEWLRDGMQPQHFFHTLWASLGFLRISVEGEKDISRFKSVALFEPESVEPIILSKQFAEPKQNRITVETSFAKEPWKTLWESPQPPFALRIEVNVLPESPAGIEKIETPDDLSSSRFFANFHTGISSRKNVGGGQDSYSPIVIPFEGVADPEKIVWTDRYEDQIALLKQEREDSELRQADLKKEDEAVRKQIFNEGSKATPEMRKKRNDLSLSLKSLKSRIDEIGNILDNLPTARQKILENPDLRFEYAVYLERIQANDETADSSLKNDGLPKRLKNEESMLLLKSQGAENLKNGKADAPSEGPEKPTVEQSSEKPEVDNSSEDKIDNETLDAV